MIKNQRSSADLDDPAFRRLDAACLNTGQGIVQLLDDGADLLHAVGEEDLLAVVVDASKRGNNGCGAAQTRFFEDSGFNFSESDHALCDLEAQIVLRDIVDAAACDGGQDAVGCRDDQVAVLIDEDDVGAAGLLDLGAGGGIEIEVLRESFPVGFHNRQQAHRVVQA